MNKKRCSRCRANLDTTEFNANKAKMDGLDNLCRVCRAELNREYRADLGAYNDALQPGPRVRYKCSACGGLFPESAFHHNRTSRRGRDYQCKECRSLDRSKRYRKRRTEEQREDRRQNEGE